MGIRKGGSYQTHSFGNASSTGNSLLKADKLREGMRWQIVMVFSHEVALAFAASVAPVDSQKPFVWITGFRKRLSKVFKA